MPGIDESLLEAVRLPGARGAALVDWISGLSLGAVGEAPGEDPDTAAAEVAEVARISAEHRVFAPADALPGAGGGQEAAGGAGQEPPVEDVIVTTASAYHVLRFVPTAFDSSVCLHLWLDRAEGNLAMARIRLAEVVDRLVLG
ncbi:MULTISPECIES: hypothetical protein [Streptomyces]|uniref:Uncharacterized protein n=1 Tax=Streptomyces chilikensis TaxID=1194079 RepID=A0ABV3EJY7_9ACTN|nr:MULTISPECIES: hypothetical protein [Streptomyces]MDH6223166.1 hypothetical protein [Streptomyces sp. MJP52]